MENLDHRIRDALDRFANNEIDVFRRPVDGDSFAGNPDDPETFARLVVYLAIHQFGIPLFSYEDALTEGPFDCGLDGIAVSLGNTPLRDPADAIKAAEEAIEGEGDGRVDCSPRVLLVQAKRSPNISNNEVKVFGVDARNFLTLKKSQWLKHGPNENVDRWWTIYDSLRGTFRKHGIPFEPEVRLLFAYSGLWSEERQRPEASRQAAESLLHELLGQDNAHFIMWGANELVDAVPLNPFPEETVLKGATLVPLPTDSPAAGFIGFAPASSIVSMIPQVAGHLDERVFIENVRSFLGSEKSDNPGAFGLAQTLQRGEGEEVLLKHNGITIVAAEAIRDETSLRMKHFQIVNGAQTTFVLHELQSRLQSVNIPVKVVVTGDERLKDEVIRGANTQAPVHEMDLLGRLPKIREIEESLLDMPVEATEKLWLLRRRGERLYDRLYDQQRIVTPRHLMEAFAAAILGCPEKVHGDIEKVLRDVKKGVVFAPDHDVSVYLAMGWLVVAGRRWADRHKLRWEGRFDVSRDAQAYPARFQFMRALWMQVDPSPQSVNLKQENSKVRDRFDGALRILTDPQVSKKYENIAGGAVKQSLVKGKAKSAQVRTRGFTEKVESVFRPTKPVPSRKNGKKKAVQRKRKRQPRRRKAGWEGG